MRREKLVLGLYSKWDYKDVLQISIFDTVKVVVQEKVPKVVQMVGHHPPLINSNSPSLWWSVPSPSSSGGTLKFWVHLSSSPHRFFFPLHLTPLGENQKTKNRRSSTWRPTRSKVCWSCTKHGYEAQCPFACLLRIQK